MPENMADAEDCDPIGVRTEEMYQLFSLVFDTLIGVNGSNMLVPSLAMSWRSGGERIWLISLRQGVTWHDGSSFTADDVVSTYDRIRRQTDGYYSDASRMFMIGNVSPEKRRLVEVTKECLEIGREAAKPFGFVGDIGHAIQKHAEKNGYSVVRDLCGHGVGLAFHEEPEVCHFGRKGTGMLLVPGMVFTIEPMINMGTWHVFIDEADGWTVVTEDELPSAQWEHTFVMTETGLEVLTY